MQQLNWDNLRYVLMVANKGSISAAARELGVNRSTVLRRIERFQQDLNCRIFDRNSDGYALTPEAEKMIDAAREVESTLFDMQRQIEGQELRLEGKLCITTTDTFMVGMLAGPLARFRKRHPHILIDVLVTNRILDLTRRDADIAIRPASSPEAGFASRKLCDVQFSVYCKNDFVVQDEWNKSNWVGVTHSLHESPVGEWLDSNVEPEQIVIRCDSLVAVRSCAEEGMGLALLPTMLGNASPKLRQLEGIDIDFSIGLWLLIHPDLVRSARVSAIIEHMNDEFSHD
jgi:DNA-binding transcriptional LysR family regulator